MVKREEGVLLQSIVLDRDGPHGLSVQICVGLRELILSGALKVSAVDQDGNEQILALVHPAGFIGELFAPF